MNVFRFSREEVIKLCFLVLKEKRIRIEKELKDIIDSVNTETKSSVGDKHETARARMQAEQQRLQIQFYEIKAQSTELEKIQLLKSEAKVTSGSLVFTDSGVFFVAIALGKIQLEQEIIQVVSAKSPFVMKMIGLKVGDAFEVNGKRYCIMNIA
jgi:transcription elongation GreA/GreB family factor